MVTLQSAVTLKLRLAVMMTVELYPRFAEPRLTDALADTPAVLIHGPRQCGSYVYFNFDDNAVLAAAQADPAGFVSDLPDKTILDEVQHAPWLFTSLKTAIDRKRTPG